MAVRTERSRTAVSIAVAVSLTLAGLIGWQEFQRPEPGSVIEMESALDQELLAYAIRDDRPLVVFKRFVPMVLFDGVCLGQVDLDWMANGVQFAPEWKLSSGWSCIDRTNDPASVGFTRGWWGDLLYGQVNDSSIVAVEALVDGDWLMYPVAEPGYLVQLPDDGDAPDEYRFLDANGVIIWSVDPDDEDDE